MWFLISFFILVWIIAIITFGLTAYWVHALFAAALALGVFQFVRRHRK